MSITLENTSKMILVFNLDHEALANDKALGPQEIKTATVDHLPDGTLIPRKDTKMVPASLTLLAGETRADLPDGVTSCAQIKEAIRLGSVRVVSQEQAPPQPERAGTVRMERKEAEPKEPTR